MKKVLMALALVAGFGMFAVAPATADAGQDQITICHTGNGKKFVPITIDKDGVEGTGHAGSDEFDIIPSFDATDTYPAFGGKNWDADGQAIYNGGTCDGEVPGEPQDDLSLAAVTTTPGSCDAAGSVVVPANGGGVEYSAVEDGGVVTVTAVVAENSDKLVAAAGWVLAPNQKSATTTANVPAQLSGGDCAGTPQEVPATPKVVQTPPALPHTGAPSNALLWLGSMLAAGGAFLAARRRELV